MGQGACQAIEGAFLLSECLGKYAIDEAFKHYQDLKMKKAKMIVNMSWMIGKMAHLQNPIARSLRDFMLKMTPTSVNEGQMERLLTLDEV